MESEEWSVESGEWRMCEEGREGLGSECVVKQSEGVSEKRRSLEICKRVYTFLRLFLCVFLL